MCLLEFQKTEKLNEYNLALRNQSGASHVVDQSKNPDVNKQ